MLDPNVINGIAAAIMILAGIWFLATEKLAQRRYTEELARRLYEIRRGTYGGC